jgi:AcrR family transcriptional regulator
VLPTTDSDARQAGRAAPLPPAERREAIINAVLPLLVERGPSVTSRELAAAAEVAEGTIFKVFTDKDDLLVSAVRRAIDPEPFERAVAAVDPSLPFEARLVEVTGLMQRRMLDIWRLLHQLGPLRDEVVPNRIPDYPAVTATFAAEPGRVRIPPDDAARRLRAITLAMSNPMFVDPPLSPAEIVDVFLHGVEAPR